MSYESSLGLVASNPHRQGLPRRDTSLNDIVKSKTTQLGGSKPIYSVLVANNGLAAVKFIRSIRTWAYTTFGNERAVGMVAMATPEDIRCNAAHIRLADQFVEVPGGPNLNNYANVQLIVQVAERSGVDAVWPGWGHASENPALPTALAATSTGITFLGPGASAMAALGDKIGSSILAQGAGVPTLAWSGSNVSVSYSECDGVIPPEVYASACVSDAASARAACAEIGYPIMLKASAGGGGKGIRRVTGEAEVERALLQVQGEVPGSPVFAMQLAPTARHLEVQLLCDAHGGVMSLHSRDCSVQRRHQKIVEEAPVTVAPQEVIHAMEVDARAMARAVGYVGAATVEYLYTVEEKKFYFLELNPRLQVEHPVTEWITSVNIPAAQLMIGMGIPLHCMPDVRRLYGLPPNSQGAIDFERDPVGPPDGHVMAVRITSEDAHAGFTPTCGTVDALEFKTAPQTWGYFSIQSGGAVHEYSDSQFGHLFAKGDTRQAAIAAMVVALKEIKIRGNIRSNVDYVIDMVQSPDIGGNAIHTGWLDRRILSQVAAERPLWHLSVIAGALVHAEATFTRRREEYLAFLKRGHIPPPSISLVRCGTEFIIEGVQYCVEVVRLGPSAMKVVLLGQGNAPSHADVVIRALSDGGLLIQVDGEAHAVHSQQDPAGTRLSIDLHTCLLEAEADPSRLTAACPGKLTRALVGEGRHVSEGDPYGEVEVMKMLMPLTAPASGVLRWEVQEGGILAAADLIARLELDDPSCIQRATPFSGTLPTMGPPEVMSERVDHTFQQALEEAQQLLAGYPHPPAAVAEKLLRCLGDPALPLLQWAEQLAKVRPQLPAALVEEVTAAVAAFEATLKRWANDDGMEQQPAPRFPTKELSAAMSRCVSDAAASEQGALERALEPLLGVAQSHDEGAEAYACRVATQLLLRYLEVEERFRTDSSITTERDIIDNLRRGHSGNLSDVLSWVMSHQGVGLKSDFVLDLMGALVLPNPALYTATLHRLAALSSTRTAGVAEKAQLLLSKSLLTDMRSVVARSLYGLDLLSGGADPVGPEAALHGPASPDFAPTSPGCLSPGSRTSSGHTPSKLPLPALTRANAQPAGVLTAPVRGSIRMLVESPVPVDEALASLLAHADPLLRKRAIITYIERTFHPYLAAEPALLESAPGRLDVATWLYQDPDHACTAADRQLRGCLLSMPSLQDLGQGLAAASAFMDAQDAARPRGGDGETGVPSVPARSLHLSLSAVGDVALHMPEAGVSPVVAKLAAPGGVFRTASLPSISESEREADEDAPRVHQCFMSAIGSCIAELRAARCLSVISVVFSPQEGRPLQLGYRWEPADGAFLPAPLLLHTDAHTASVLQLGQLAALAPRKTPTRNEQLHAWCSWEHLRGRSQQLKRSFLRTCVRQLGRPALLGAIYAGNGAAAASAAVLEVEETLVDCLKELEHPNEGADPGERRSKPDWAHIFINVLSALPLDGSDTRIAHALKAACAGIVTRHGAALRRCAVARWEIKLAVKSKSGPWHVVIRSPTGHESGEDHVEVYRCVPGDAEALMYSSCEEPAQHGTLHGQAVMQPYTPLDPMQQKRLAARRHSTTYCYDMPAVFRAAVRELWTDRSAAGEPLPTAPSGSLVDVEELIMAEAGDTFRTPCARMVTTRREIGSNTVGVVAWLLSLRTPECPQGRQLVAVANDITFQAGAFGPAEDAVFRAATEHALECKLPLVFLAANSGARVGLAAELKSRIKPAWIKEDDPAKGIKYLYLEEEDYHAVQAMGGSSPVVIGTPVPVEGGAPRYAVSDVIGVEDGLGVECLSGSAAIARAYSQAFREGWTCTLVSGRTVGVGAYLARLGRRCVQRSDQPIVLTGFAALNKLLGRDVYTSHLQLGGPHIMAHNGISHHVVQDDLEGVKCMLWWLSYVPVINGDKPPVLPSADPVARAVEYAAPPGGKFEPRAALGGCWVDAAGVPRAPSGSAGGGESGGDGGAPGEWRSGLFDRGSWTEAQAGWARTVVTGRARLAGIPVGVVAVEPHTVMLDVPADPGSPDTEERMVPQAGQVWYPDSANKTAQALEEFNAEGLPLFIVANWRGFSGGLRDLYEGVLQAGALILDHLRTYKQPVFVYIPPGGELRGGAWVVIDSQVNSHMVEMYADPGARGGVLEPEGIVEIKFRRAELLAAMHRGDPVLRELDQQVAHGAQGLEPRIKVRERQLLPVYHALAVSFAEMHDTPQRMVAKQVLHGIVPWRTSRQFFAWRLRRRLAEEGLIQHVISANKRISRVDALAAIHSWFASAPATEHNSVAAMHQLREGLALASAPARGEGGLVPDGGAGAGASASTDDDEAFTRWAESNAGAARVAGQLRLLRSDAARLAVAQMVRTDEGQQGLMQGLLEAMHTDPGLKAQLLSVLDSG